MSDRRVGDGLAPIEPLIFPAIERAEELYGKDAEITGLLVVVDYLQLMSMPGGGGNCQQEIATISRHLKNLARELHLPVIAVSQLNRSMETREDKRPRLGDLRESGAIEQDADVVMFIYRHEYYDPEVTESRRIAEINIAKDRQGPTGKFDMAYKALRRHRPPCAGTGMTATRTVLR